MANHEDHADLVKTVRLPCGCSLIRCFVCKTGVRMQCSACGGKIQKLK